MPCCTSPRARDRRSPANLRKAAPPQAHHLFAPSVMAAPSSKEVDRGRCMHTEHFVAPDPRVRTWRSPARAPSPVGVYALAAAAPRLPPTAARRRALGHKAIYMIWICLCDKAGMVQQPGQRRSGHRRGAHHALSEIHRGLPHDAGWRWHGTARPQGACSAHAAAHGQRPCVREKRVSQAVGRSHQRQCDRR